MSVAGEIVSAGPSFKPEDPLDGCYRRRHRPFSIMSKAIEEGSRREASPRIGLAARSATFTGGLVALTLFTHCASAPPPPAAAPEPTPVATFPEPPPAAAPAETAAESESESEPEQAPAPAPEPEPSGPTRPASEVITEGDTDFLFDDSASALKEAVRQKCDAQAPEGSDPKVLADCRQKERDKFAGDVLSFQATEGGAVTLIIYRRKGSRLDEVYRAPVVLKDQNPTTVQVSPKGGKGARPFLQAQREFTVQIPDNYSLVIEDPTLGKLVYRAKVGVVSR